LHAGSRRILGLRGRDGNAANYEKAARERAEKLRAE
jgi:hypothetical protein